MSEKIRRTPNESAALVSILSTLIDAAKIRLQLGTDINGRPVTQRDFAIVNEARKQRDRHPPKATE